jgi:hypothetical protein
MSPTYWKMIPASVQISLPVITPRIAPHGNMNDSALAYRNHEADLNFTFII